MDQGAWDASSSNVLWTFVTLRSEVLVKITTACENISNIYYTFPILIPRSSQHLNLPCNSFHAPILLCINHGLS